MAFPEDGETDFVEELASHEALKQNRILKKIYLFIFKLCVCVCICKCVFVHRSVMPSEARKVGPIPLELEFQVVVSHPV